MHKLENIYRKYSKFFALDFIEYVIALTKIQEIEFKIRIVDDAFYLFKLY